MKKLAILGASGHGKVAAQIAEQMGWATIDFFDARWLEVKTLAHWNVVGSEEDFFNLPKDYMGFFVAIGDNKTRKKKLTEFSIRNPKSNKLVNLIAKSANTSTYLTMESGILIAEGACININTTIAQGVIVNTGATIDHDCDLGDCSHICPGVNIAGNVSIGQETMIGIGSSIIQGVTIGKQVTVGAGSVILKDVMSESIVAGVPAKLLVKDIN